MLSHFVSQSASAASRLSTNSCCIAAVRPHLFKMSTSLCNTPSTFYSAIAVNKGTNYMNKTSFSYDCKLLNNNKPMYSTIEAQKDTLPRLPVPDLLSTMDRYLKSVKPLITEEEFLTTEKLVKDFVRPEGDGPKLQSFLQQKAASAENWMSNWWIDTAYFKFREPVVVWSSPGLVFPLQEFENTQQQLNYASKMIAGALDYKRLIDTGCIPMEMMGKNQLDMSQYFKVFSTCRIPGLTKDSLCHHSQDPNPPKHIVIMHKNHFFKLDVYGKADQIPSPKQIFKQLENVLERSTRPAAPLGILTTQNRNVWGQAYKVLKKASKDNISHLKAIQEALFVVCLDSVVTPTTGNKMTDAALQCVHGMGSKGNAANRWFDKTIQFVIGKTGHVGLTYEHSPAEGPPIANLMDHVVHYMESGKSEKSLAIVKTSQPERLEFTVPNELDAEMDRAKTVLDSLVNDLEMTCFNFHGFGKNFIKSQKISPDSFIQMAIQFAFYRIHEEAGAHYESASTRMFLHGRTETIRSCSIESVAFCQAMLDGSVHNGEKLQLLREAVEGHKEYVKMAVSGQGVDRHLLGLKLAAIEEGMDVPELFMDVGYIRSSHMRISSSQVAAKCEAFMCYGPLVPDGYGCCYNPRKDSIVFGTSALNSSPQTYSGDFKEALVESLNDMKQLLLATSSKL